jgi:hypothetical protein
MLKAELGHDLTAGVAAATDTMLQYQLDMQIKLLATEYDWPFMETRATVPLLRGTRYYNLPATLSYERKVRAFVSWNDVWIDVTYGIGESEWNSADTAESDWTSPARSWNFFGAGQFEIWPVPDVAQTFSLQGQAVLGSIVAGDACVLDDVLVVLSLAGTVLAKYDEKHAQIKMQQASRRLGWLLSQYPRKRATWNLNPDCCIRPRGVGLLSVSEAGAGDLTGELGERILGEGGEGIY